MIFQNELSHNHLAINNHNGYEYEQCYLSDGNEGAAIAQSGTKNNIYEHYDKYIVKKALAEFKMKEAQCLGDVKQLLKLGQEYLPYIIKAADLKPTDGYKFIPIVEQGSLMIAEVKLDVNEQGKLDKDNMGRIYVLNNDGTTAPMFMTWVDLNDRNFFDGLNDGLAGESSQLIDGVKEMLEHPIDTVKSLSGLISDIYNDPALLKRISKEKLSEWEDQLKIFETGNDYQRGKANGELIVDVLATFSGVGLDEKLASEVPKMAKLEKIFSADEIVVRPTKVIEGSG
ncbi:hypothetical protein, partial [Pectinatus frisingensis]|uniref:hypothetical protein n=1 Tax=Pectinatus frisingensis TaxID=865 RepID=UPI0018C6E6B0